MNKKSAKLPKIPNPTNPNDSKNTKDSTCPFTPFPNTEFIELCSQLEQFHSVFYKLWTMGKPVFDSSTKTAYVSFDETGEVVTFATNPDYWKSLTKPQKLFTICHEALHVILNHGHRFKNFSDLANIAADIVINHALVQRFGFKQSEIDPKNEFCWINTVFSKDQIQKLNPNPNSSTESIYNLLKKETINSLAKLLDDHSKFGNPINNSDSSKVIDNLNDSLSDEDKQGIKDIIEKHYDGQDKDKDKKDQEGGQQAGTGIGSWTFIKIGAVSRKKKWETVIKKWANKFIKSSFKDIEQWARINRRFVTISSDLMIPTEMEMDDLAEDEKKIDVFFFLDTSGSCWGLKERFFKAAKSLPPERFNIRLFCFDTCVHETTLESGKIYGGGGTYFHVIEHRIQSIMKTEKLPYPAAVFIITDGYGDHVQPQQPEKWYWFLSNRHTSYIPKESHVFALSDYE